MPIFVYLFHFNSRFYIIPLDITVQKKTYHISKLLYDFTKSWFIENASEKEHLHNHIEESNSTNERLSHRNALAHHIQNKDQFDEEDDQ